MCFIPVPGARNLSFRRKAQGRTECWANSSRRCFPITCKSFGACARGNDRVRVTQTVMNMEGQVRIITVTAFVAMSVACGGSGLPTTQPSPNNAVDAGRSLVAVEKARSLSETLGTLPSSGRFKAAPDGTCTFDPNDSGPDQCTPAVVIPGNPPVGGRFKAGPGGTCVFVPNDGGPNQCTPAGGSTTPPSAGRFKAAPDGTCTFDPNDAGPNQCTPAVVIPGNPPVGGRFKAGPGGTCVFVPNDGGPNQCTP
jgi:hypothetical protein